jgi:exodeoxyribonuclease V alpha subunit
MDALLKAVSVGTRLILVGDVNQLPSVGPGNILKDIISSGAFTVVKLHRIFRQAALSDIVTNAHKINKGESIVLDNKSKDFFMMQSLDVNQIAQIITILVRDKMPAYVNAPVQDIQVLTPMKKGEVGVERLNTILQSQLNPPSKDKKEKEAHGVIFREGDKVMQIKNNYQMEWEVRSRFGTLVDNGMGIFNGDCGIIRQINTFAELITIEFDEGKMVEYKFNQLDELELAYAITIHKSQGSEYPAVVIPLLNGPKMLMNRNLLYTAVTRAKSCVTIVGSPKMVELMIGNESETKRYSSLGIRIREFIEG